MKLDPFYLIVDSAEWIAQLVPLGVKLVQLCIKDRPETELCTEIRRALAVCAKHQCQLIVNDHWRLRSRKVATASISARRILRQRTSTRFERMA